jgi:hypothetical protein
MAMLMPDLVLAVALEFERHGLRSAPHVLTEPMSDSEISPSEINVLPIPPLTRKIRSQDLSVLNDRRAGNRGKAKLRRKGVYPNRDWPGEPNMRRACAGGVARAVMGGRGDPAWRARAREASCADFGVAES